MARSCGRAPLSPSCPPEGPHWRTLVVWRRRRAHVRLPGRAGALEVARCRSARVQPRGRAGAPSILGAAVARVYACGAEPRALRVRSRRHPRVHLKGHADAPRGRAPQLCTYPPEGLRRPAAGVGRHRHARIRMRGCTDAPSGSDDVVARVFALGVAPARSRSRASPKRACPPDGERWRVLEVGRCRRARHVRLRGCTSMSSGSGAAVTRVSS